jgi:hypothetical protein
MTSPFVLKFRVPIRFHFDHSYTGPLQVLAEGRGIILARIQSP